MKVIAYDSAKVTILFPFEEVSPIGGQDGLVIINKTADRYNFVRGPDLNISRQERDKIGLRFETGSSKINDELISIGEFTIHGDGVVIVAKTTIEAEIFWDDLVKWMRLENHFRDFTVTPVRRFISQIVVEFSVPLSTIIPIYSALANAVSAKLSEIYDAPIPINFSGLDMSFDKVGSKSAMIVPDFKIERRAGIAFDRERYYCSAPLRTSDHVEILELIERYLV